MFKSKLIKIILTISIVIFTTIAGMAILSMYGDANTGLPSTKTSSMQFTSKDEKLIFLRSILKNTL